MDAWLKEATRKSGTQEATRKSGTQARTDGDTHQILTITSDGSDIDTEAGDYTEDL